MNPIAFTTKFRLSRQTGWYFSIYKRCRRWSTSYRSTFCIVGDRLLVTCNWKFIYTYTYTVSADTVTRDTRYATIVPGNWLAHSYFRLTLPTIHSCYVPLRLVPTATMNFLSTCTTYTTNYKFTVAKYWVRVKRILYEVNGELMGKIWSVKGNF